MSQKADRDTGRAERFTQFARDVEPRLRIALAAAMGPDVGMDATAEALAWGWQNWERLETMENPAGYLYRVGRSHGPRRRLRTKALPPAPVAATPRVEPGLPAALAGLSERQRIAVVMIHGYQWTAREVADLLNVDVPTVSTHLRRGLEKLRWQLGVKSDD